MDRKTWTCHCKYGQKFSQLFAGQVRLKFLDKLETNLLMSKKFIPSSLSNLLSLSCLLALLTTSTQAQVQVADIDKPNFESLSSPDFGGRNSKKFRPKDWLEIEAAMKIPAQNRQQTVIGFIDKVQVKWYLAMKDEAVDKTVLLTKDITHVNVPVDEEVFSSVYLSPNTLTRLTGSDKARKGSVIAVALEVLVNGVKVGEATSDLQSGWWTSANLSRGDQFPLSNKNETPFKNFWWDRYAEIEPERR